MARMLLRFPAAGTYSFIATIGTDIVESGAILVPSGPPVSLVIVAQPTPTSTARVFRRSF